MTWEALEKGSDGPSLLGFDMAWVLILSARSLLISWLPYFPCSTWAWNHAGGRCSPVLEKVGFWPQLPRIYLVVGCEIQHLKLAHKINSDNELIRSLWSIHQQAVSVALWLRRDKFTWTTESCGGKGMAQPLSQGESTLALVLTGFYWLNLHRNTGRIWKAHQSL